MQSNALLTFSFAIVILLLSFHVGVKANWMYLGLVGIMSVDDGPTPRDLHHPGKCDKFPGLTPHQKYMCRQTPSFMPVVSQGAQSGLRYCQHEFKFERWNCSNLPTANDSQTDIFASLQRQTNKETAFLHAVTSAMLAYEVAKACSSGLMTECGCDMSFNGRVKNDGSGMNGQDRWKYGGCSDNFIYGERYAKEFLDSNEKQEKHKVFKDTRLLARSWNNEAGRKVLHTAMLPQCRCHGVSGSCEMKTCWYAMPKMEDLSKKLKFNYDHLSVQVKKKTKNRLKRRSQNLKERNKDIPKEHLVYINRSPDYCERDEATGIFGTAGRECLKDNSAASCEALCCGRGYDTRVVLIEERCNCKFVWCCNVKCKTCPRNQTIFTCK